MELLTSPRPVSQVSVELCLAEAAIAEIPELKENRAAAMRQKFAEAGAKGGEAVLDSPLVVKARELARLGFVNKYRKIPAGSGLVGEPYFNHLEQVAQTLARYGFSAEVVAAAYLHDHLEDLKEWSKVRLAGEMGWEVAVLVDWVTQQDKRAAWKERTEAYATRLLNAPAEALAISAADKISNMKSSIYLMELGYTTKTFLKQGWAENSRKFHQLDSIFEGKIPDLLLAEYRSVLERFDTLGEKLERPGPGGIEGQKVAVNG